MTAANDWDARIIEEFRGTGGKVGGPFEGLPLLLLHTTGAKTGAARLNPAAYQRIDDRTVAIFASKGGSPTHPGWYHNLRAHPEVTVEIGTDTLPVTARIATGDERERIWARQKRDVPAFADYETKTDREIPVVILESR